MEAPCEIRLQTAQYFFRKRSVKMLNLSDLGQRSMNDLDLRLSCTHLFGYMYTYIHLTGFINLHLLVFLHKKKTKWTKFDLCKIGQSQPRVII